VKSPRTLGVVPFSPPTQAWFDGAFEAPTAAQELGWDAIGRGEHTVILAPTGSGKTLAAFLWALDRLVASPSSGYCRILYVSPLKALTYDVERNLRSPLAGIAREAGRLGVAVPEIQVATRTGDTPAEDRSAMLRTPPDILITTPESLYLLLSSRAASMLAGVDHVIVDEIHALAGTKRGAHLALSLERLEQLTAHPPPPPKRRGVPVAEPLAPHSFQRIGLSATQRPLEEIARFLGGQDDDGQPRPVRIVDAGTRKPLELQVVVPVEDMGQLGKPLPGGDDPEELILRGAAAGTPEVRASIWPSVYPRLLELIRAHRSTLIFVNSRRLAERLAARLNELAAAEADPGSGVDAHALGGSSYLGAGAPAELVRAHHGSVAREQRLEIEDALKAGRLPGLVATSSLELGIDMGAVDLVVQVESPASVASGLQRIGRAGHRVGEASKGRIFPKFRHDLLVAAVVAERMRAGLVEETRVPRNPLDVLAQHLVATVAAAEGPVPLTDLAAIARRAYPFAELSAGALEGVVDMLAGRYPSDEFAELRPRLIWDRIDGTLSARPGAKMLAVTNGGTIPDRGLYAVVTPEGNRVGELDEEMVYESRVGETFLLGATTWRIEDITRDRVVVTPAPGVPGKMPYWHGDALGRPYELGVAVGEFTRRLPERSDEELAASCSLDPWALRNLRAYVAEEIEATGGLLPTDRQVVVERFRDELGDWRLCVLSPFGARVHAPWALAIQARLRAGVGDEDGIDAPQAVWSDDGIIVRLPEADTAPDPSVVAIDPAEVEDLVVAATGSSALFAGRFRDNAARALLLPRRRPGSRTPLWQQRQRAADLLAVAAGYPQFPILLETYRECLRDVFDLPALTRLLADIAARRVRLAAVELDTPSPFASGLASSYVAAFLYEGDAPLAERRAQALTLDRRMLAELLGTDELRDLLDGEVLAALEDELQALDERRFARDPDGVADLLRRLGDLSPLELAARCVGGSASADAWASELVADRRAVWLRVGGETRLVGVEDAARYRDALGVSLPVGLPEALLEPVERPLVGLLRRWARTHGPFTPAEPAARFGVAEATVLATLGELVDQGRLEQGGFRPGGGCLEWCDTEVLRQLRQRSLAALRAEVEPAEPAALGRFLPAWQGVAPVGGEPAAGGIDRLHEVIAQIQGIPLPASVLERDVLAARVRHYAPRLLDELAAAGEVLWVGAGTLGRDDGRVVLALRDRAGVLLGRLGYGAGPWADPGGSNDGQLHDHLREVLGRRGACFFRELRRPGASDHELLEALWDLVWAGEVTSDGFGALRATVGVSRRVRSGGAARRARPARLLAAGPPRAQGRWSLVARELDGTGTGSGTEAGVAIAGLLLDRYGILTRDAVRAEGVPGGFATLYPVLRGMEESGRVRRGYFVTGLGGAQFAAPGAVDRLRSMREPGPNAPAVHVLAATDPANPYGVAVPWPAGDARPARAAGAYVVLLDGEAVAYLERGARTLVGFRPADGTWETPAVRGLGELVRTGRLARLALHRWPEHLDEPLREAGFVPTPKGLVLHA
jgi:ATP-dependent Lhr-like helicase